jgi:uncharacterized protein YcfJ
MHSVAAPAGQGRHTAAAAGRGETRGHGIPPGRQSMDRTFGRNIVMNKSLIVGLVAGVGAATAIGAIASYSHFAGTSHYAEVVDVKPALKPVKVAREVCHDEQVTRQQPVKDEHQVAGSVAGAVIGGLLGSQVGGGSGKTLATVAGAAAGGYAGNRVQDKMQKGDTYTTTEQRCETVYDSHDKQVGYDVTYTLGGKTGKVRMDHNPGARIPVRDGRLVLEADKTKAS